MKNFTFISIGLATISLTLGYSLSGLWAWTPLIVFAGLLWLAGQWYDGGRYAPVGLILLVGAAAWGVWYGAAAGWMLGGTVAALIAWDLDHFSQQLNQGGHIKNPVELKRGHLQRLLIAAGLGLLLAGAALSIQLDINFGWALLLGLLVMVSLSWIISLTRGENG